MYLQKFPLPQQSVCFQSSAHPLITDRFRASQWSLSSEWHPIPRLDFSSRFGAVRTFRRPSNKHAFECIRCCFQNLVFLYFAVLGASTVDLGVNSLNQQGSPAPAGKESLVRAPGPWSQEVERGTGGRAGQ